MSDEKKPARKLAWAWAMLALFLVVGGGWLYLRGKADAPGGESARERDRAARLAQGLDPNEEPSGPAGGIEGVVKDAEGQAVDGATVVLTRGRGPDSPPMSGPSRPAATTTSVDGGRFRFDDVQPGEYGVAALASVGAPAHKSPVAVRSKETTQIELTLGRGGVVLSGRILDAGGGTLAGARVVVQEFMMGGIAPGATFIPRLFQATSGPDGSYKLLLSPGTYSVSADSEGYAPARIQVQLTRALVRDLRLNPASRIEGRVVEHGTGKAVPEAEVFLQTAERFSRDQRQTLCDGDGNFRFVDLDPGAYVLTGRKGNLIATGKIVSVATAEAVSNVELAVTPGLIVSGHVRTPDRKPVPRVRVNLNNTEPPFTRAPSAKAKDDGSFRIEGVLPGKYRAMANADGFSSGEKAIEVRGQDLTGVELSLSPELLVTGRVLDVQDKPVEGAYISARVRPMSPGPQQMMGAFSQATSRADGTFELKRLGPGQLSIGAQHADRGVVTYGPKALAAGEKKVITLKLASAASISGTVRFEDGRPAPGVSVGAMVRAADFSPGRPAYDTTDEQGRYRLQSLSSGEVQVSASRKGSVSWMGGIMLPPNQKNVTLAAGEQRNDLDLTVPAGGKSIAGTVVAPDGKAVSGAVITASFARAGGRPMKSDPRAEKGIANPDGSFTIEDLDDGTYLVWAMHPSFPDAEVKDVTAGATGVKLQFAADTGLAGVVTGKQNQPALDYQITLLPGPTSSPETPADRQRRLRGPAAFEAPSLRVHDPSGEFAFTRVTAGGYELRVTTPDGRNGSLITEVKAGEKNQNLRIVIEAGLRVTGRVLDFETGAPMANVEARVFAPGDLRPSATADQNGAFTIEGVPPDPKVQVSVNADPRTYVSESKELDVPAGANSIDAGVFKLVRGNAMDQFQRSDRGITGIGVQANGTKVTVRYVAAGSVGATAGIKPGDAIVSIDGKDTREMGPGAIMFFLNGKVGSSVNVTVESGGSQRSVTMTREAVKPPSPPGTGGRSGSPTTAAK